MLMTRGEATVRGRLGIAGWLLGPRKSGRGPTFFREQNLLRLWYQPLRDSSRNPQKLSDSPALHSERDLNFVRWSAPFHW
jgi:hypothetical protein